MPISRDARSFLETVKNYCNSSLQPGFSLSLYQNSKVEGEFVPISHLHPGQTRFSWKEVKNKYVNQREKIFKGNHLPLPYDQGKSVYPLASLKEAILTRYGLILLDGHHSILASMLLGAQSFPVRIVSDLSRLKFSDVGNALKEEKRIIAPDFDHICSLNRPLEFHEMKDDPNRYLAALIRRKIDREGPLNMDISGLKGGQLSGQFFQWVSSSGTTPPLWFKSKTSPSFIEFHIGDVLRKYGIHYRNHWGKIVPYRIWRKAFKALKVEKDRLNPALTELLLVQA